MQETQETQVHSLDWEGSLEKEMATHSSILARKIRWTEEPGWLQSIGSQRVRYDLVTKHTHTLVINHGSRVRNPNEGVQQTVLLWIHQ